MASKDVLRDDKALDQQIHDAYERIELSDEAQERMLANLLAAQRGAVREQVAPAPEETPGRPEVTSEQPRRGHVVRLRWMPLAAAAAAVVAALVVVSVAGIGARQGANMSASEERVATETAPTAERYQDGAAASKSESSTMAPEADAAEEAEPLAQDDRIHTLAALYPQITLADGRKFTALADGVPTEQVEPPEVGELVGEATAAEPDDPSKEGPVSCKVYQLKSDANAYAVQYASEDTYWRCAPVE